MISKINLNKKKFICFKVAIIIIWITDINIGHLKSLLFIDFPRNSIQLIGSFIVNRLPRMYLKGFGL